MINMIDLIALQNTVQKQAETIKRLKDALKPFSIKEPIGISFFWMNDFDNARTLLEELEQK